MTVAADRAAPGLGTGPGALREAWQRLGADRPLIVRSSSAHEDTEESSMAGRFTSVLDVRGWDAFTAAAGRVLDPARAVGPRPARTPGARCTAWPSSCSPCWRRPRAG